MIYVELDPNGRLLEFRSMPAQKLDEPVAAATVDWAPLFRAAEIEPGSLKPDAPRWNFLEASDTRAAWTGTWPGSDRPLRIEAVALGGARCVHLAALGQFGGCRRPTGLRTWPGSRHHWPWRFASVCLHTRICSRDVGIAAARSGWRSSCFARY
jgi:hypothetical protein